jgi:hypothetical protein
LPEQPQTPLLSALLTEEPHVVASKGTKSQAGRSSARTRGTSVTRSEETNTSAAQDGGAEEGEEEILPPKGKRSVSEDADMGMPPKGQKRPRRASSEAANKSSERVELSGDSEEDPLETGRKKPAPRG